MSAIRSFNGHAPVVGSAVFVDASAVVTGQVSLGDGVSVWPHVSIRGDLLAIQIGARSNIQDGSVLHTTQKSAHAPNGFALILSDSTESQEEERREVEVPKFEEVCSKGDGNGLPSVSQRIEFSPDQADQTRDA